MVTVYRTFVENTEIMDVLLCVIAGKNSAKDIKNLLHQKQARISNKLAFLRKNRAVLKKKWKYEPNWTNLNRVFLKSMKSWLHLLIYNNLDELGPIEKKADELTERFIKIFDEERVERILRTVAKNFINIIEATTKMGKIGKKIQKELGLEVEIQGYPIPISELTFKYLEGVCQTDSTILNKIDKRMAELKEHITIRDSSENLFLDSEGVNK